MNAIVLHDVFKQYGSVTAVANLSVTIEQGSVVALLGPNGAGKTTAISMILGLEQPTSGTVRLLGENPRIARNRQHIGVMLQQVSIPDKTSVRELIQLFCSYYKQGHETDALLQLANLEELAQETAGKLSGGQQRRLQFALAMAGNPQILILDEPTTGMDVSSRQVFWEQLRKFAHEDGRTIILTTHHLEEADNMADRILLLQKGRLVADGTPLELKKLAGSRFISATAHPTVPTDALAALSGVVAVQWSGHHFKLRTNDSDVTLRELILSGLQVSDIEVSNGGLEDAFLRLTEAEMEVHAR